MAATGLCAGLALATGAWRPAFADGSLQASSEPKTATVHAGESTSQGAPRATELRPQNREPPPLAAPVVEPAPAVEPVVLVASAQKAPAGVKAFVPAPAARNANPWRPAVTHRPEPEKPAAALALPLPVPGLEAPLPATERARRETPAPALESPPETLRTAPFEELKDYGI
jgi:hypothetical protein